MDLSSRSVHEGGMVVLTFCLIRVMSGALDKHYYGFMESDFIVNIQSRL